MRLSRLAAQRAGTYVAAPATMRDAIGTAFVSLVLAGPAAACPICPGATGEQVRAGLADGSLGISLAATLLPFCVLAGVVALVRFGPPRAGRSRHDRP